MQTGPVALAVDLSYLYSVHPYWSIGNGIVSIYTSAVCVILQAIQFKSPVFCIELYNPQVIASQQS